MPVLVRDVAEMRFGHAVRYGIMTRNNEGEAVGAVVLMLKGANSSTVIKAVKERMATIQKTLPDGVLIEPFLDRTKLVNQVIGTVGRPGRQHRRLRHRRSLLAVEQAQEQNAAEE